MSYKTLWSGAIPFGSSNTDFVNCVVIESEEHGFYVVSTGSLEISDCYFQLFRSFGPSVNGFKIASHCVAASLSGSMVKHSMGDGIYLWQNVSSAHVKGNEVLMAQGHGISLWRGDSGGTLTNAMVHDNVVTNCAGSGIRSDCAVSKNEFWHNRSRNNIAPDSFLDVDSSNVSIFAAYEKKG